MSNRNDHNSNNSKNSTPAKLSTPATPASYWTGIHEDLKKALDMWKDMENLEKISPLLSSEEKQLAKIKSIIIQLKMHLDQF